MKLGVSLGTTSMVKNFISNYITGHKEWSFRKFAFNRQKIDFRNYNCAFLAENYAFTQ